MQVFSGIRIKGNFMLKLIGYWSGGPELIEGPTGYTLIEKSENWIDPHLLVDESYEVEIRPLLVSYLKRGVIVSGQLGYSFCRFSGGPPDNEMGSCEQTDGVWVWPEGLWIYVEQYKIRLPKEFIDHVKANAFRIPPTLDVRNIDTTVGYDIELWKQWCERENEATNGSKK
jgi:hypothetical protein